MPGQKRETLVSAVCQVGTGTHGTVLLRCVRLLCCRAVGQEDTLKLGRGGDGGLSRVEERHGDAPLGNQSTNENGLICYLLYERHC